MRRITLEPCRFDVTTIATVFKTRHDLKLRAQMYPDERDSIMYELLCKNILSRYETRVLVSAYAFLDKGVLKFSNP